MPSIRVDRPETLSDQPVAILLEGFPPNGIVEVVSRRRDLMNNAWRGWARFRADGRGMIDVRTQAPVEGSYSGAHPMGLFWSMELVEQRGPDDPIRDITEPIAVRLAARARDGDGAVETEIRRRLAAPDVTDRWLRENGMVGRLFLPPGDGPHPAMIVLSGSSGGINLPVAALLASHGYAALALGYFAMEGLPPTLDAIPLEYFGQAIAWLRRQAEVKDGALGVTGTSRGGELALLLGATFPEIRAVVAYVPSGVIHSGLKPSGEDGKHGPAWTLGGEPQPWLQQDNRGTDNTCIDWNTPPFALTPLFESMLRDREAVARALIPVERINGPVLLISGTDDQMWPSTALAELAVERLTEHGHPHVVEHLVYEGAGHLIFPPFAPTTRRHSFHAVLKADFTYGGSAEADARACIDSWPKVLSFLKATLAR